MMRKTKLKFIILIFIFLVNCELKNHPNNIKITSSPSSLVQESSPLELNDPYKEEKYTTSYYDGILKYYSEGKDNKGKDNKGKEKYCKPLDNTSIKSELKYPVDLAVTQDGNTVYVLNKQCGIKLLEESKPKDIFYKDCDFDSKFVERHFIYKITKDKNIEVLKDNKVLSLSCQLGEEIEIDTKNNLYVTGSQEHIIYKILTDSIVKIADTKKIIENIPARSILGLEFTGPAFLYFDNNNLYYEMYYIFGTTTLGYYNGANVYKIDSNQIINEISNLKLTYNRGWENPLLQNFSVFENQLYKELLEPKEKDFSKIIETENFKSETNIIGKLDDNKDIYNLVINPFIRGMFPSIKINSKQEVFSIFHNSIIKRNSSGYSEIFAGNGNAGLKDGKGKEVEFNRPSNMSFDARDNLYVSDTGNNAIRKITPDATVSTFYVQKTDSIKVSQ